MDPPSSPPGMESIPFGIGIDQFNSAPIPELERELELKDFEWEELELELELKYFDREELEFELNEKELSI